MVTIMTDGRRIFRFATLTDIGAMVALVESAYRGEPSRIGWTTEADILGGQRTDTEDIRVLLLEPSVRFLLAVQDDVLVGSVLLRNEEAGAYIGMFAVRPMEQGHGLGRLLLALAESALREQFGVKGVRMTVLRQRKELIAWYERRGYTCTGETEPFPYGDIRFGLPKRSDLEFLVMVKAFR
jgi:ribosomal protein S18 acetylase RimI-like enzyme